MSNTEKPELAGTNWIFLLVGLLQGLALWWITAPLLGGALLSNQPAIWTALFFVILAIPLAFYWTGPAEISGKRRVFIIVVVGVVFTIIGWHLGGTLNEPVTRRSPVSNLLRGGSETLIFAAGIAGIILVHLLSCLGTNSYQRYFQLTWHNAIASKLAIAFSIVLWAVLLAGSTLLMTLNISIVSDLLSERWFNIPVTSTAIAFGYLLAFRWQWMTTAVRRFWLILTASLLPLTLAFGIAWVVALAARGLNESFSSGINSWVLLWFLALSVYFLNAAWQDGDEVSFRSNLLRKFVRWSWLTVIVITAAVGWALAQRIGQYGWTVSRGWGVVISIAAGLYAVGYALPGTGTRWMPWVGRVNIYVAVILCASLLLLVSPVGDIRKLVVNNQVSRLLSGAIEPEKFSYKYIHRKTGKYGVDALTALADGSLDGVPSKVIDPARDALKNIYSTNYWGTNATEESVISEAESAIEAWTDNGRIDPVFLKFLYNGENIRYLLSTCTDVKHQCALWTQDLDNDSNAETLLIRAHTTSRRVTLNIFESTEQSYQQVATASQPRGQALGFDEWRNLVKEGPVPTSAPRWQILNVPGSDIRLMPRQ